MTTISGSVQDIGMQPVDGVMWMQMQDWTDSGVVLLSPKRRQWPIIAGQILADVASGRALLTIHIGEARGTWRVTIPATGTVSIRTLITQSDDFIPNGPAVVEQYLQQMQDTVYGRLLPLMQIPTDTQISGRVADAASQTRASLNAWGDGRYFRSSTFVPAVFSGDNLVDGLNEWRDVAMAPRFWARLGTNAASVVLSWEMGYDRWAIPSNASVTSSKFAAFLGDTIKARVRVWNDTGQAAKLGINLYDTSGAVKQYGEVAITSNSQMFEASLQVTDTAVVAGSLSLIVASGNADTTKTCRFFGPRARAV